MSLITVPADVSALIDAAKTTDTNITITNDLEQKNVAQLLSKIKADSKSLSTKKSAILSPLNKAVKEIRLQFKPAEDQLTSAETACKSAILKYHTEQEAIAQAQITKIENDNRTKIETKMQRLVEVDKPETSMAGAQIKYGPAKVVVIDPLLVPQMYLYEPETIDAIRKCIARDIKAGAAVPAGVKMVREKLVAGIS